MEDWYRMMRIYEEKERERERERDYKPTRSRLRDTSSVS